MSLYELEEIASAAYIYAYPLVLMEVTRRVATNVDTPRADGRAPMNQFAHMREFVKASSQAVRPNTDTLYSLMWFNVADEPLIISVPDSGGRYYLLPMMDLWTEVFASPGKRTTGTAAQTLAIVGPEWEGALPPDILEFKSATALGWVIGRTQINGKADLEEAHRFQAGMIAAPLSRSGAGAVASVDPSQDISAPAEQVDRMDAGHFFALFAELMKKNPPHAGDATIIDRMRHLGIVPGQSFNLSSSPRYIRAALEAAPQMARGQVLQHARNLGTLANGWRISVDLGNYGTDYACRAAVARSGIGANLPADTIYPYAMTDEGGVPLSSESRYTICFEKGQTPPVKAFWSLALYQRTSLAENPIDRHSIGDRDPLAFSSDGSLTIYVQREDPGGSRTANWLPAPANGRFNLTLRLYWPEMEVLAGGWRPPPVVRLMG